MTTPNPSRSVSPEPTKGERRDDDAPLTIEEVDGGLVAIIDERWILHELVMMLLEGGDRAASIVSDRVWLSATFERTRGRVPHHIEGLREVLPIGETRAGYIAAWNEKCRELAAETARCTAIRSAYIPLVEAAEAAQMALVFLTSELNGQIGYVKGLGQPPHGRPERAIEHAYAAGDRLRAALVQVPGQQQADTEQGGV